MLSLVPYRPRGVQLRGSSGLGDVQTDLKNLFSILPGTSGATALQKFNELIAFIREQAKQGALEAVPTIKAEVTKTVAPLIITSLAVGGLGLVIGLAALARSRS